MEAARVAALRGHRVTLLEKDNALGGNLITAGVPEFKADYRRLLDYLSSRVREAGVEVRLGIEATVPVVRRMKPDVVFIATGGTPIVPDIPGLDKKRAVTAIDVLAGKKKVGKRVVIIGGGVVGCETALYLAQQGKEVAVVARHGLARDMNFVNRQHMLKLLAEAAVKAVTYASALEITDKGVAVADREERRTLLEADSVIFAVGLKPNDGLIEALRDVVPEIRAIGDCVEPRKVINAIWEGFRAARLV